MAIPGPFSWKNNLTLNPLAFQASQIASLRAVEPKFLSMGVALVDISKRSPVTFASNFTKTGYAASLPKIAAMFAAFYLQDRLKTIKGSLGTSSLAQIERLLRKEWTPAIRSTVPRSARDFPDITAIFASPSFDFSSSFTRDMRAMIKKSSNSAAGRCIRRIGFDYLNGALTFSGLYSPSKKSGLWLALNYAGRRGARIPGMGTSQAASAQAVSLFLVNLAYDKLISARASKDMKGVMTNAGSWISDVMKARHPGADVYGKYGVGGGTHDCAIVKYANAHYVMVTLFGGPYGMDRLYVELDRTAQQLFHFRKVLSSIRSYIGL